MPDNNGGFWPRFEHLAKVLSKISGLVGALCLLAAALVTTEGVVVRKILHWSTTWQIELSVFLLMYACFVGAAYGQMGEHHINIDLLLVLLPARVREMLLAVTASLSCLVCVVIAVYAWPVWWESLIHNEHSESLWGPPLWIPYVFLPLGLTLLFLQSLAQLGLRVKAIRKGTYEETVVPGELRDISVTAVETDSRDGGAHE
jgi:TRAP-type C4-dicarboxylate transport system permease small subunit